jgi:hypothetical protein
MRFFARVWRKKNRAISEPLRSHCSIQQFYVCTAARIDLAWQGLVSTGRYNVVIIVPNSVQRFATQQNYKGLPTPFTLCQNALRPHSQEAEKHAGTRSEYR